MFNLIGFVSPTTNAFQANNVLSGIESAGAAMFNSVWPTSRPAGAKSLPVTGVLNLASASVSARLPTGNRRQSAPITAARVVAQARVAVQKYWTLYQKQLPEAFSNPALGLSRTPPIIRFARSKAEYDAMSRKATGFAAGNSNAFVDPKAPNVFYVNTPQLTSEARERGMKFVDVVVSHELVHLASSGMLRRMQADWDSNTPSSAAAKRALESVFYLDEPASLFEVRGLLTEFPADYFAEKLTGIPAMSSYGGHVKIGRELIKRVGEATLRKALFANDRVAYRKVLECARGLSEENKRENDAKAIGAP